MDLPSQPNPQATSPFPPLFNAADDRFLPPLSSLTSRPCTAPAPTRSKAVNGHARPAAARLLTPWIPCRGAAAHARATRGMECVCVCARRPLTVRRERRRFNSKVKRFQGRAHSKSPVIDAAAPPCAMHCVKMRFVADAATIAEEE